MTKRSGSSSEPSVIGAGSHADAPDDPSTSIESSTEIISSAGTPGDPWETVVCAIGCATVDGCCCCPVAGADVGDCPEVFETVQAFFGVDFDEFDGWVVDCMMEGIHCFFEAIMTSS